MHHVVRFVVAVAHASIPAEEVALRLRRRPLGVFARIKHDKLLIDPRTVQDGEEPEVAEAVLEVLGA